jgi:hypothetical protein
VLAKVGKSCLQKKQIQRRRTKKIKTKLKAAKPKQPAKNTQNQRAARMVENSTFSIQKSSFLKNN